MGDGHEVVPDGGRDVTAGIFRAAEHMMIVVVASPDARDVLASEAHKPKIRRT